MNGKLKILKPGLMTSIQDFGRKGIAFYAIPKSGVMDEKSAQIALLLLDKGHDHPLIECTTIAPHVQFKDTVDIVLTGADFRWTLNDEPIFRNQIITINKNDILRGHHANNGMRGYIALDAQLNIPRVYESYSTYTNAHLGGFQGRLLKKGDILQWTSNKDIDQDIIVIPIHQGPEFDVLTMKGKADLCSNIYKLGTDSNRMGIRLKGDILESTSYQLAQSAPVLPGFIQLPPSGMPIILLQDGQTTGGYPRIAYIQEEELSKINQMPLGSILRFELSK